jgi:thiosulfate/3-mercaptopyruvate sulfurtransferase
VFSRKGPIVSFKLSLVSGVLLLLPAGPALADSYPAPDLLIEAAELVKPAVAARFRVLDTRARSQYLAGHIPGALWIDHAAWARAFAAEPDRQLWQQLVGDLGIKHSTPLVVYDDGRAGNAAHVWWVLRYWGCEDVRLLNAGWKAWKAEGASTERALPAFKAQRLKLRPIEFRLARKDQVLELLQDRDEQLIDARSATELSGGVTTAGRKGPIPSSRHLDSSALVDPETGRFKSAEDLTKLFAAAGIDPERPAVISCQSGDRAALMVFSLELMGARNVRNYYQGSAEGGNANDTPVVPEPTKK